jgi:hypothetical protein
MCRRIFYKAVCGTFRQRANTPARDVLMIFLANKLIYTDKRFAF